MFSSTTRARAVQVRIDLAVAKKNDLSAADYFCKIKSLASELVAADAPLRDDEIIAYLLAGLPSEYDSFITSMTTKTEALSIPISWPTKLADCSLRRRRRSILAPRPILLVVAIRSADVGTTVFLGATVGRTFRVAGVDSPPR
jgi:hypothetical protein